MKRDLLMLLTAPFLLLCIAVWLGSYAVAVEWTFRPAPGRWCQAGLNFGTVFFATRPDSRRGAGNRVLFYDARDRGVSLKGFGFYFSRSGRTPGGTGNVLAASVPLWLPVAAILTAGGVRRARARRRASRAARGFCPDCGYDLRAASGTCPECGGPASVITAG